MRLPSPDNIMKSYPFQLSGGMRQRVGIAMGMTYQPKLLLADEPTSALDVTTQAQIVRQMMELRDDYGTGIIVVTHNLGVAAYMSDYIVVMKDGLIHQVDSPQKLYSYPCNTFVAGFIGSPQMNFVDCRLIKKGDTFYVEFGSEDTKTKRGVKYHVPLPAYKNEKGALEEYVDKDVLMGIRPEDVHDEPRYLEKFADDKINEDVEVTEMMGAETYLYLTVEGISMTARVEPTSTARPSDTIEIVLDNERIHLFDKETERAICH